MKPLNVTLTLANRSIKNSHEWSRT